MENIQKDENTQETTESKQKKIYKTPDYVRKSVNRYVIKQKLNNPEEFLKKQRETSKRYYNKHKKQKDENIINLISDININSN